MTTYDATPRNRRVVDDREVERLAVELDRPPEVRHAEADLCHMMSYDVI